MQSPLLSFIRCPMFSGLNVCFSAHCLETTHHTCPAASPPPFTPLFSGPLPYMVRIWKRGNYFGSILFPTLLSSYFLVLPTLPQGTSVRRKARAPPMLFQVDPSPRPRFLNSPPPSSYFFIPGLTTKIECEPPPLFFHPPGPPPTLVPSNTPRLPLPNPRSIVLKVAFTAYP